MNDFEDHRIPFKDFLEELATESKANLDKPQPTKVNSVYAPLGTKAAQPTIAPKKVYPKKVQSTSALLVEFGKEFPHIVKWLGVKAEYSDFARSLQDYMIRKGTLTENQIAAVERSIARDNERKIERAARVTEAPVVDVSRIETAFRKAQENDVKTPKMNLGEFHFSLAPAHGKNPNAIYVKRDNVYLGKIANGRFFKVSDCDDETADKVVEVASNPHEAAKAYGERTGSCSVCGRILKNRASIDAKIGPICASKYGW